MLELFVYIVATASEPVDANTAAQNWRECVMAKADKITDSVVEKSFNRPAEDEVVTDAFYDCQKERYLTRTAALKSIATLKSQTEKVDSVTLVTAVDRWVASVEAGVRKDALRFVRKKRGFLY